MKNAELGRMGESFAAELLTAQGYRILERNFRCKMGEIDLIAERDGEISFVEVKTRRNVRFGTPAEAVTKEKQRRMRAAAQGYLCRRRQSPRAVSFQVVEILCNQICHAF